MNDIHTVKVNNRIGFNFIRCEAFSLDLVDGDLCCNFGADGSLGKNSYHRLYRFKDREIIERTGLSATKYNTRICLDAIWQINAVKRTGNVDDRVAVYQHFRPDETDDQIIKRLINDMKLYTQDSQVKYFEMYSDELHDFIIDEIVGRSHFETQWARNEARNKASKKK